MADGRSIGQGIYDVFEHLPISRAHVARPLFRWPIGRHMTRILRYRLPRAFLFLTISKFSLIFLLFPLRFSENLILTMKNDNLCFDRKRKKRASPLKMLWNTMVTIKKMSEHVELLNLLNRRDYKFRARKVVSEPVRRYCGQPCDVNPLLFGSTISIQPVTGFVFYTLIRAFRAKKVCGMQIKHVRYSSYLLLT